MTVIGRILASASCALAAVGLIACAPQGEGGAGTAVATTPAVLATASPDATGGTATDPAGLVPSVRIGLTEWSIEAADEALPVGTVRILVTNVGATGHDLLLRGSTGVWRTPVLPPGESDELVIFTTADEQIEAVCTVAGHHGAGMHRLMNVAAVAG